MLEISSINSINLIISFFILILIICIYFIIIIHSRPKQIKSYAERIGFRYLVQDVSSMQYELNFNLFKIGHSRKVRNIFKGNIGGFKCFFFDYRFDSTISSTKKYSVVQITFDKNLPSFFFASRKSSYDITDYFNFQEKLFTKNVHFDNNYIVKGEDDLALDSVFDKQVINYFEKNMIDGFIEASGQDFIFYKKLIDTRDLNEFFLETENIIKLFR